MESRQREMPIQTPKIRQVHPAMEDFNQYLRQLVTEAANHPVGNPLRQRKLQELYRLVMKSGKLWKEYTPYYNDALQQMWEYCCQHPEDYDSTRGNVITWLDYNLKKRLRNFRDAICRKQQREAIVIQTENGQNLDPVENVAAHTDIQPTLDIWQQTLHWVKTDPDGVLRNTCFRKRADINCQTIFLMRFPSEAPWQTIAEKFALTPTEAKDLPKWYNRKCLSLLRKFGVSQGYIN